MRIRTVKPEFFLHEGLFELDKEYSLPIRLAFAGLWCAADREGRFKWEPRKLGIQILPYDQIEFSRVLDALLTRAFIVKYRVGNDWFGAIPSFPRHQIINNRERDSELPEPIDIEIIDASVTRESRVEHAGKAEGKGREGKGREGNKEQLKAPVDLPFEGEAFSEAWGNWVKHRKEIKKPLTPTSVSAQLKEFSAWGEPRSIRAIYHTIKKGWQGLKEPEPRDLLTAPPKFAEIAAYGASEPEKCHEDFFDHMEKSGWYDRSGPVYDWQAAFRLFASRWHTFQENRN